jgi:hypothetical protein
MRFVLYWSSSFHQLSIQTFQKPGDSPRDSDLLGCIANTLRSESKLRVGLGQGRTVEHGADTILTTSLAQTETRGRSVRDNVAANRFGGICRKGVEGIRL